MTPSTTALEGVTAGSTVQTSTVRLKGELKPKAGSYVYEEEDRRFFAANSFAAVVKALDVFQSAYGEPISWATGKPELEVTADAGKMLNAYYSRQDGGLFFWHDTDPVTGQVVHSAASGEVVAHEAGHAILDALRPGYFSTWSPDPGAFHESFGDILALLVSLKDERVLDRVVEQTGGDLSKPNLAAALGEQLGSTINHAAGKNVTGGDYTRTAINQFVWQDPNTLPDTGPPEQLTPEVHNFSRLWTGAYYDMLKGIVDQSLAAGQSPREAIARGADESLKMLGRLLRFAPEGDFRFADMAGSLIQSEQELNQGKYTDLIKRVFLQRKILPDNLALSATAVGAGALPPGTRKLEFTLDGPHLGPLQGCRVSTVLSGEGQGLTDDESKAAQIQKDIARLHRNGDILMTLPNEVVPASRLFKPNGEPYVGVVRWIDGQMTLERVSISH